jgi:tetrapyrrole methylase family protein/MazG family protein
MNAYPADHQVILIHAAGTDMPAIERLPLFQVDQSDKIGILTTLVVPPLSNRSSFEALQETVAHLRAPEGCPWDQEQTNQSLRPHVLEEAYEVVAALDKEDMQALKEELGDLLLQIVLQAQIATESDDFRMGEVIAGINDKLIRRHPHVFADLIVEDVDQVLRNWESLKAEEQKLDGGTRGLLEGVPTALPALSQAYELQMRAAQVGFEWPDIQGVIQKIREELEEWQQAETRADAAAEMGDLLFALVNYARWMSLDAEAELQRANRKFRARFDYIEQQAKAKGMKVGEMSLEEMDAIWEESKTEPKIGPEW